MSVHGGPTICFLFTDKVLIGRDVSCDMIIENELISRKHLILHLEEEDVKLEDLGSSNGTTRNGRPVEGEIILCDGDRINIGSEMELFAGVNKRGDLLSSLSLRKPDRSYVIMTADAIIGRSADEHGEHPDVALDDPSIAARHAKLSNLYGSIILTNLASGAATTVNEEKISEMELHNGDNVMLGNLRFIWKAW